VLSLLSGRSGNPSFELLKHEFYVLMTTNLSVDSLCSVAKYLAELGQYDEAGVWFETAASLVVINNNNPIFYKASSALEIYSKALECFSISNNLESYEKVLSIICQLEKLCMGS
jgi:tetratricopeptide (TPR) repeat protein